MSADDAFFQGLRDFGWMEGQNIFVERRFAAGNILSVRAIPTWI
jgi:hypothetical protein